tara:strand:- start:432 stop:1709 length:1278 start_codon:yes stop_codon:yes gene_type:complete
LAPTFAAALLLLSAGPLRGDDSVEADLRELREAEDRATRKRAADRLAQRGQRVAPRLVAILGEDFREEVRRNLVRAFVGIGPPAAPDLVRAFADTRLHVGSYASRALTEIGPGAVPALMEGLKSQDANVKTWAMFTMVRIKPTTPQTVEGITTALRDRRNSVRIQALKSLQRLGPLASTATPEILALLHVKETREPALRALQKTGGYPELVVPELTRLLSEGVGWTRIEAARALGGYGHKARSALPALLEQSRNNDPTLAQVASHAIRRIGQSAKDSGSPAWWFLPRRYQEETLRLLFFLVWWFLAAKSIPRGGGRFVRALRYCLTAGVPGLVVAACASALTALKDSQPFLPDFDQLLVPLPVGAALSGVFACLLAAAWAQTGWNPEGWLTRALGGFGNYLSGTISHPGPTRPRPEVDPPRDLSP